MINERELKQFNGGQIDEIKMHNAHGEFIVIKFKDGRQLCIASQTANKFGVWKKEQSLQEYWTML